MRISSPSGPLPFKHRLDSGEPFRLFMAEWFREAGFEVEVPPYHCDGILDNGDLFIWAPGISRQRIETKHLQAKQFTCAEDFPQPTIWLGNVDAMDRADPDNPIYVLGNGDMTVAAFVANDVIRWETDPQRIRNSGRYEKYYECLPTAAEYIALK